MHGFELAKRLYVHPLDAQILLDIGCVMVLTVVAEQFAMHSCFDEPVTLPLAFETNACECNRGLRLGFVRFWGKRIRL